MNLSSYTKKLVNRANRALIGALDFVDSTPAFVELINKHDDVRKFYVGYRPKTKKFLKVKKAPLRSEVLFEDLGEGGQAAYEIFLKSR